MNNNEIFNRKWLNYNGMVSQILMLFSHEMLFRQVNEINSMKIYNIQCNF